MDVVANPVQDAIHRTASRIRGVSIRDDNPIYLNLNPVAWIEHEFYIPERIGFDNPAMQLAPYQKAMITEAYRTDADGKFLYDFVLWSDVKKSAKSSIAAAVILERALRMDWGSIKVIANDLKQADSRVFFYIRRAIELNPRLRDRVTIRNYKITLDNHTVIEAIPVDPDGEAGGNDDLLEFTELHAFNGKASLKLWTEMTISPTKYGYSQRWADTYAGMSGESAILEPIYEQVVKPENRISIDGAPDDLEVYAKSKVLCLWNTTPRLEWQTPEYYASESVTLTPNEFLRVHRNQWTSSVDAFVHPEWWRACEGALPDFDDKTPVIVGMDAGVSNDCFAIVGVSRLGEVVYVRFVRVYKPPQHGTLDFGPIETEIKNELAKQFNVVQITFDPYQLHDMSTRLTRDSVAWMKPFPQGQDRLKADKQLYDTVRDKRIVYQDQPMLTDHVLNANAQVNKEDHTLRIIKRADHLKIDACVALSMASSEARRLNL